MSSNDVQVAIQPERFYSFGFPVWMCPKYKHKRQAQAQT